MSQVLLIIENMKVSETITTVKYSNFYNFLTWLIILHYYFVIKFAVVPVKHDVMR
jgi:hypothetical protein